MTDGWLEKRLYDIAVSNLKLRNRLDLCLTVLGEKPVADILFEYRDFVENVPGVYIKKERGNILYNLRKVGYEHLPEEVMEAIAKDILPLYKIYQKNYDLLVSTNPYLLKRAYSLLEEGGKKKIRPYTPKRHEKLGKFFGYPDCCIKAFLEGKHLTHPQLKKKLSQLSAEQQFYLEFTFHLPCNIDCRKSLDIGKKRAETIYKYVPSLYREIETVVEKRIKRKNRMVQLINLENVAYFFRIKNIEAEKLS